MSGPGCHLYCDARSREALAEGAPAVLLLGSYLGYGNFGDILQLKGAIAWHRRMTGLRPVLVCDAAAIPDPGFAGRLFAWFDIAAAIFWCPQPTDLSPAGLAPLPGGTALSHLHVYGGGFLNRFWGRGMVDLAESLHRRFGIGHYVLTGQQVDPAFAGALGEHFRRHRPVLAGGRDERSVEVLKSCGAEAAYSFDDGAEPLQALADVLKSKPAEGAPLDALIHANLSGYTGADEEGSALARHAERLKVLHDHVARRRPGRRPRVALLAAYMDRRADLVADTLAVVQQLEDSFPFDACEVIHLARLAAGSPEAAAGVLPTPARDAVAVTSSYHVSLLCTMLGIPCHLEAMNAYYEQKREGIGLPADSLEAFLEDPRSVSLSGPLAARRAWLERLQAAYGRSAAAATPEWDESADAPGAVWKPKGGLLEVRARLRALDEPLQQAGRRIQELEDVKDKLWRETQELSGEARRLAQAWETHNARLAELEAVRDNLWKELQGAQQRIEELYRQRGLLARLAARLRGGSSDEPR